MGFVCENTECFARKTRKERISGCNGLSFCDEPLIQKIIFQKRKKNY